MAFKMKSSPFNQGKKKSTFGGTPDSTDRQKKEEAIYDELYDSGKITETNNKVYKMMNSTYKKRHVKTKKKV